MTSRKNTHKYETRIIDIMIIMEEKEMKRVLGMLLLLVFLTTGYMGLRESAANAEGTLFKIYNQREYSSYSMSGGSGRTLASAGCGIFMTAHAIQWLTGTNPPITTVRDKCGDTVASYSTASSYLTNQYDIKYDSQSKTEAAIKSTLDGNAVIMHHGWGHYILAVDYKIVNGTTYIHIVDSSAGTTIRCIQGNVYRFSDMYETKKYKDICKEYADGAQYWVKCSAFLGKFTQSSNGGLVGVTLHKLVAPKETELSSIATFIRDDEVRVGPRETSDLVKKYSTGSTVNIVASVINSYGNTWYKTSEGNYVWSGDVELNNNVPDTIELNPTSFDLNLTDTLALTATVYPDDANNRIVWTSSDDTIATVSNTGVVTPHQAGKQVTITATSALDSNVQAFCVVNTYYDGSDTLKYNGISYPGKYNQNDNGFNWYSSDGTITSDVNITKVTFTLYNKNGQVISTKTDSPNKENVSMATYNTDIKLSQLKTNGSSYLEIIAEDAVGRKLNSSLYFETVSSGSTTRLKFSRTYKRPEMVAVSEDHKYELYSSSYTWEDAKTYAESKNGYLACVGSNEENSEIQALLQQVNAERAWIGGYYNGSGYSWVTGENLSYTHWASGEPSKSGLNNYCMHIRSNGYWYDTRTNETLENHYFVVEYPKKYVEEIIIHGETAPLVGDTFNVTATVLPSDASDPSVIFSSSDSSIVTIDENTGAAVAVSEGVATITATAQDGSEKSASYEVHVQRLPIRVISIEISANGVYSDTNTITMNEGETIVVFCSVNPSNADNQGVYFYSTNNDIAYVEDYTNAVVARNAGTCEIVAVSDDNEEITDRLTIVVKPKLDVLTNPDFKLPDALQTIEEEAFAETEGALIKLNERVLIIGNRAFADCIDLTQIYIPQSVTYISPDAFDGCGKFTIVGYQNSVAQTFANSHEDISFVALDASSPDEITFMEIVGGRTIDVNETITLNVIVEPANISDKTVIWRSNNPDIASVDGSGRVTGISGGSTVITATSNFDSAYSTYVMITVNPTAVEPTESDWVLPNEVPDGAEITQTSWSYRESVETTASTLNGWIADDSYWSETGSGSMNYATFPSGYKTSNAYYTSFAKAPYSASNDGNTKRVVVNSKAGYIYWHWMYSTVYASGTGRRISSKTGYYNASGASGSGSEYYGYLYFYAMASTVDCPYLSNDYCCGQNLPSYNCKSIIPSNADKSNTSGLGTDRFFRFEYYLSTYTDYQMIYAYHRDLEYQSSDPGDGDNISDKVMYVKYLIK